MDALTSGSVETSGGEFAPLFINNTFVYRYGHRLSYVQLRSDEPQFTRATSGMDTPILFHTPCFLDCSNPYVNGGTFDDHERQLSALMASAFTNFMYSGDPRIHQTITNSYDHTLVPNWSNYQNWTYPDPDSRREVLWIDLPIDGQNSTNSASVADASLCGFWAGINL